MINRIFARNRLVSAIFRSRRDCWLHFAETSATKIIIIDRSKRLL